MIHPSNKRMDFFDRRTNRSRHTIIKTERRIMI